MPFYKRRWNENRGDMHDDWGRSSWYFEADGSGGVCRQVEVYDAGPTLRYDESRPEDEFGSLTEGPLWEDERARSEFEPIRQPEFEAVWSQLGPGARAG